jgi:hypothetical protein
MGNVVALPVRPKAPEIDWRRVEEERSTKYPKLPQKAVKILEKIMARSRATCPHKTPNWYFSIEDPFDGAPPYLFPIAQRTSDIIWFLDLLDRLGGDLGDGDCRCRIVRPKKHYPLLLMQKISERTALALDLVFGSSYEHFLSSNRWQILGKKLTAAGSIALVFRSKLQDSERFLVCFDRRTAFIFFERLEEGLLVEELLALCPNC